MQLTQYLVNDESKNLEFYKRPDNMKRKLGEYLPLF